jgi:hypothetical protein
MSSNAKRSRPAVPRVYTSRNGSRYVHSIDVIRSEAGRKEIGLQMQRTKTHDAKIQGERAPAKDVQSRSLPADSAASDSNDKFLTRKS